MSQRDLTEDATQQEVVAFRVADQDFCFDIMSVREIRGWTETTTLPHAQSYVKGVINLRGTVLPVMDLAERLGLAARAHTERNVIIVVKHADTMTGLLVDAVSDIIALKHSDLQSPPESSAQGTMAVIKSLTLIDERMIRVLDLPNIIALDRSDAA